MPLWIIPSTFSGLAVGAFCIQFEVQGAWGVIPIHLAELALPAFRATLPGVAHQLGNLVPSSSAQTEVSNGPHLQTILEGVVVPDYAKVQGILLGIVAAFWEANAAHRNHGSHFARHRAAFDEGEGDDDTWIDDDGVHNETGRAERDRVRGHRRRARARANRFLFMEGSRKCIAWCEK
ncbi:hypothetical protein B0H16DRAFT_1722953 [Mycena metata]|uniref:Uncharacterized protein n=1 Tax=Mycena metata TaxID=1033252 RepID=A0AAD7NBE5_9AGAR|nr:hypothetical protein B0H16DRAFT_1722953 [Mycena metata]